MAALEELLRRARGSVQHARTKMLAKNDYKLMADLVQIRISRGLTQPQVAERLGISQQAVSKLESYSSDPRLSTIRRYANAVEALVAHVVEADEGQLANGRAWIATTYTTTTVTPNRTYPAEAVRRVDYSVAA
ncbi:helix-turn-helix domain-containing protein [Salinibacterium sp.]|uniref:helix-turn-helix domain-containing protein n=1 Tax=Salinibacterium sp. TaxID=1915057 RepID=UPI00286CE25F|nr:helix-turn-helix domain-containing protein [Salinibacterium sp.]